MHTVEGRFVRAAWFNPARTQHVACEHGVTAAMFTDEVHRFMFAYVGLAVECGFDDRITVGGCAAWAQREGITIDPNEWLDGILAERAACDGDLTDELPELAGLLVSYTKRRERARALLAELAVVGGEPTDSDDLTSPSEEIGNRHSHKRRSRKVTYVG